MPKLKSIALAKPVDVHTDEELASLVLRGTPFLEPWMREFSRWLADQPPTLRRERQLAKLSELTGTTATEASRLSLFRNTMWHDYYVAMREKGIRRARHRLEEMASDAVESLGRALKRAEDAEDYKAVPGIATPILERTLPRRDATGPKETHITITLTTKQAASLDSVLLMSLRGLKACDFRNDEQENFLWMPS